MSKPTDQALAELRKVDRLSSRRKNKPPKELALIVSSSSLHQEAIDTLLRQVEVANEYDKKDWLHSLAAWLDSYQFHDREWISRNISPLGSAKKRTWEEKPAGTSKDIRLDSDPTIERTGEHLSPDTELLLGGEESSMEVDLEEAEKLISLSPHETARLKPVSPVKPQRREQTESAIPTATVTYRESMEATRYPSDITSVTPASSSATVSPAIVPTEVSVEAIRYPTEAPPATTVARSATVTSAVAPSKTQLGPSSQHKDQGAVQRKQQDQWKTKDPRHQERRTDLPRSRDQERRTDLPRGRDQRRDPPRDRDRDLDRGRPKHQDYDRPSHSRRPYVPSRDRQDDRYSHPEKRPRTSVEDIRVQVPVVPAVRAPKCPVAGCGAELRQKHAMSAHVPGVFHPEIQGEDVSFRRMGALKLITRWLLGASRTLQDLVTYLDSMGLQTVPEPPSQNLNTAMTDLCAVMKIPVPDDLTLKPSGNKVTALLHWKALVTLISMLEKHQEVSLREQFDLSPEERLHLPEFPKGFDSHCHLDRTMRDLGIKASSLEVICQHLPAEEPYEIQLTGAVGVFCDPETYPSPDELDNWIHQGVVPVLGLHPKRALTEDGYRRLRTLLDRKEVAGLGEIGIDRTEPATTWADQMQKLERLLFLLQQRHVLVLHCRSVGDVADEAILSVMYMLQGHPAVHRDQLIHLHCYTGTWPILKRWLESFPNTYFGFTAVVAKYDKVKDAQQMEAVVKLDESRLLAETDAPYFSHRGYRRTTPGLLGMTVAKIAEIRRQPWKELLLITSTNAKRLYISRKPPAVGDLARLSVIYGPWSMVVVRNA